MYVDFTFMRRRNIIRNGDLTWVDPIIQDELEMETFNYLGLTFSCLNSNFSPIEQGGGNDN